MSIKLRTSSSSSNKTKAEKRTSWEDSEHLEPFNKLGNRDTWLMGAPEHHEKIWKRLDVNKCREWTNGGNSNSSTGGGVKLNSEESGGPPGSELSPFFGLLCSYKSKDGKDALRIKLMELILTRFNSKFLFN